MAWAPHCRCAILLPLSQIREAEIYPMPRLLCPQVLPEASPILVQLHVFDNIDQHVYSTVRLLEMGTDTHEICLFIIYT